MRCNGRTETSWSGDRTALPDLPGGWYSGGISRDSLQPATRGGRDRLYPTGKERYEGGAGEHTGPFAGEETEGVSIGQCYELSNAVKFTRSKGTSLGSACGRRWASVTGRRLYWLAPRLSAPLLRENPQTSGQSWPKLSRPEASNGWQLWCITRRNPRHLLTHGMPYSGPSSPTVGRGSRAGSCGSPPLTATSTR